MIAIRSEERLGVWRSESWNCSFKIQIVTGHAKGAYAIAIYGLQLEAFL